VKFFFDSNISEHIAAALNALGEKYDYPPITSQRGLPRDSVLAATKKDWEWLPKLAEDGSDWVIISGDVRISAGMHEAAAWLASGLTAFFLASGWGNLNFWDQTISLLKWWPHIVKQAQKTPAGAGYIVPVKMPAHGAEFKTLRMAELQATSTKRFERQGG